jgi:hypothetical protein
MPSKSKSAICVENLVVRTARDEHLLNDDGSTFLGHGTADLVFPTALPGSRPSIVTLKDFRIKVTPDGDFALWPATRKYVVNGVEKSAVTYWLDDGTYAVLLQEVFTLRSVLARYDRAQVLRKDAPPEWTPPKS